MPSLDKKGSDYEQGLAVPKQALDHPVSLPARTLEMITYLWALSLHEADHLPKSSAKTKTGCRFGMTTCRVKPGFYVP